jgi:hypothetical protein
MRAIAASVLVFEALVVALAIPVAITLSGTDPALAGAGGAAIALACLVVAGMLRRPIGYQLGWGLQAVVIATGFVVPAMFFLGALFAVLWAVGLAVGRKGERIEAELRAAADRDDPGTADAAPSG